MVNETSEDIVQYNKPLMLGSKFSRTTKLQSNTVLEIYGRILKEIK